MCAKEAENVMTKMQKGNKTEVINNIC